MISCSRLRHPRTDRARQWRLSLVLLLATVVLDGATAQWTRLWDDSSATTGLSQPIRRAAHAMTIFQDKMYIFGGVVTSPYGEDVEFNDTWAFDLLTHEWTELAVDQSGPAIRYHHAGVLHSNGSVDEFVVFGGLSIQAARDSTTEVPIRGATPVVQYNDVWRLSLSSSEPTWSKDPSPPNSAAAPRPRSEAGVVVHNNRLLVFGGISYDDEGKQLPEDHNDLWSYDLSTQSWELLENTGERTPPARFSHSVGLLGGQDNGDKTHLVVFSGRRLTPSNWALLDDVWLFDLASSRWEVVAASDKIQRAYTSIVTTQGRIMWFFGGYFKPNYSSSGYVFDDVVLGEFNVKGATMDARYGLIGRGKPTPPLRYNHRAALWRDDCMVIHGGSYQSQRGDVWVYNTTVAETMEYSSMGLPIDAVSLVYMLGAFLSIVALVLLVLLVRWRRADRRHVNQAQIRGVAAVRGVTAQRLQELQVTKYNRAERNPGQSTASPIEMSIVDMPNEDICPICLIEFEDGEDIRNLPCKHIFHVGCIDEWLKRNTSCPMCKSNVDLEAEDIASENAPVSAPSRARASITPIGDDP